MGFNKAREEHKWKQWKEAEEKNVVDLINYQNTDLLACL